MPTFRFRLTREPYTEIDVEGYDIHDAEFRLKQFGRGLLRIDALKFQPVDKPSENAPKFPSRF